MTTRSPWAGKRPELSGQLPDSAPRCPKCGTLLDGYTSVKLDGVKPKRGDYSICLYCATPLVFDGTPLSLRRVKGDELILIRSHPDFVKAERAVQATIAERTKPPN